MARPGQIGIGCIFTAGRRYSLTARGNPLPPRTIDAFPHGMVSAHEVETMAAIASAEVDGLSVRGQRCGIGLMSGNASREQRRRGSGGDRLLRRTCSSLASCCYARQSFPSTAQQPPGVRGRLSPFRFRSLGRRRFGLHPSLRFPSSALPDCSAAASVRDRRSTSLPDVMAYFAVC